jgi:hypothetical protein
MSSRKSKWLIKKDFLGDSQSLEYGLKPSGNDKVEFATGVLNEALKLLGELVNI